MIGTAKRFCDHSLTWFLVQLQRHNRADAAQNQAIRAQEVDVVLSSLG